METRSRMSRSLHTNRDFEKLEPYEGKPSRTVLRGEEGSNALDLPDRPADMEQRNRGDRPTCNSVTDAELGQVMRLPNISPGTTWM